MSKILMQFNIAHMKSSFNDSLFDDFKSELDRLHKAAEQADGFVWRYRGEHQDDGYIKPYPNKPFIMGNLSAWESYQDLVNYTFKNGHLEIMKDKRKWFEKLLNPYNVLYYSCRANLAASNAQILAEAKRRLNYLQTYGESPLAFGFGAHGGIL